MGGITGYLDIAAVARAHNLPMTPHFVMELSASLLATVPNISYAEMTDGGRWKDLRIIAEAVLRKTATTYRATDRATALFSIVTTSPHTKSNKY